MPRPRKDPEKRKRYQLHIPLTDAQREAVERVATLEGMDMAAWARAVLLATAERRFRRDRADGASKAGGSDS